jgi:hypothetical protein
MDVQSNTTGNPGLVLASGLDSSQSRLKKLGKVCTVLMSLWYDGVSEYGSEQSKVVPSRFLFAHASACRSSISQRDRYRFDLTFLQHDLGVSSQNMFVRLIVSDKIISTTLIRRRNRFRNLSPRVSMIEVHIQWLYIPTFKLVPTDNIYTLRCPHS